MGGFARTKLITESCQIECIVGYLKIDHFKLKFINSSMLKYIKLGSGRIDCSCNYSNLVNFDCVNPLIDNYTLLD